MISCDPLLRYPFIVICFYGNSYLMCFIAQIAVSMNISVCLKSAISKKKSKIRPSNFIGNNSYHFSRLELQLCYVVEGLMCKCVSFSEVYEEAEYIYIRSSFYFLFVQNFYGASQFKLIYHMKTFFVICCTKTLMKYCNS